VIENNNTVVKKYSKKFVFATNLPFKAKERFINDSLDRCLLEVNLTNTTAYQLNISNIVLTYEKDKNEIVPIDYDFRGAIVEPEDEVNIIYILNNPEQFNNAVISYNNSFYRVISILKYIGEFCLNTQTNI